MLRAVRVSASLTALVGAAVLALPAAPSAAQTTLTQWTFEGDVLTPSTGSGTATNIGGTSSAFAAGNGGGRGWNTAAYPAQEAGSGSAGVEFLFSTLGYQDLSFSFDHRASGTASRWAQLDYTLNGGTDWNTGFWNNNGGLSPHDVFYSFNVDFSSVTAANDNADFGVRIVSIFSPQAFNQNATLSYAADTAYMRANAQATYDGTPGVGTGNYGSSGTWRFDNVTLSGSPIPAPGAKDLTWNTTNGDWNTTAANWTGDGTTFADGDIVTFSGVAGGTVTVDAGGVAPGSMAVTATAGTYTFAGGPIGGTGSLTKSGGGTAVFESANTFASAVINEGTVRIDGADRLGPGAIGINGGTLEAAAALTLANTVTIGAANGTIATGSNDLTLSGITSVTGQLTKSGDGTLVVAAPSLAATGGFTVDAGTLQLGSGPAASGIYNFASSSSLAGNLVISGTQRVNLNAGGSLTGSGTLQFATSGGLLSQLSGNAGGSVGVPIGLNSAGLAFTPGVYTEGSYAPASFVSTIGATTGGSLTITDAISGESDVNISNNSSTGGGRGLLILGGQSTYTGNTMIDANSPDAGANVRLGVSNALPVTTGLVYGTRSGAGAAVLDLNDFDQQVAFVGDGPQFAAGTNFLTITNLGSGTSTFTIAGATSATFGGVIANGAGATVNVVKNGTGTQTLTGDHTYEGVTDILGGMLILDGSIGSEDFVTVGPDASLGGGGTIAGSLVMTAGAGFLFDIAKTLTVNGSSVSFGDFGISDLLGFSDSVPNGSYVLIDGLATVNDANLRNLGPDAPFTLDDGRAAYFIASSSGLAVEVVPEPSSLALAGLGLAVAGYAARRRWLASRG